MTINGIKVLYIAERVKYQEKQGRNFVKKQGFMVLFPDKTGNVYFLEEVPPELQFPSKRKECFEKGNIKPSCRFMVYEGSLVAVNETSMPEFREAAEGILNARKYGVGYLLAHGFMTEEMAIGFAANALAESGMMNVDTAKVHAEGFLKDALKRLGQVDLTTFGMSERQVNQLLIASGSDRTTEIMPETIVPETIETEAEVIDADEVKRLELKVLISSFEEACKKQEGENFLKELSTSQLSSILEFKQLPKSGSNKAKIERIMDIKSRENGSFALAH